MRQQGCATFWAIWLALSLVLLSSVHAVAQPPAPSWGEVRVAERLVNVRQKPDAGAPLVRTLKAGDRVRVDFVNQAGWCALFDLTEPARDETKALGYAEIRFLTPLAQAAAKAPAQAAPAGDAGQLRQVEARTEVRRERSLSAPVVAVLAPGENIKTGFARDGFVAVFRMNDPAASEATAIGYIPSGMARPLPKAPAPAARPAARPEGKSAPAPELKGEVKEGPGLLSGAAPANTQEPVRITSDKMVYNQNENSVVFLGNVHGTQGDMAIWSAKLTAYFVDNKAKGKEPQQKVEKGPNDFGDKIERIVAEGNVRMVSGKNEGACTQLTYYVQEGMLRMDGNPILREGQNTVRGDVIKFYVHENRSEVLSGTLRRVEAIFNSQGDKK